MSNVRYSQKVLEKIGGEKGHYRFGNQEKPKGGCRFEQDLERQVKHTCWESMFFVHDTVCS